MGAMKFNSPRAQLRIKRICAFMSIPRTVQEVSEHICISRRWATGYISFLRANKQIHIISWSHIGQKHDLYQPAFIVGSGADAAKPRAMTGAEKSRKYRNRLKQDADRFDAFNARRRAMRIKPRRDQMVSAFFGSQQSDFLKG
ncbi:hypothetical protein [Undibacterium crateris]|uniref:hypothetical protein n=1 Tax=Undibacterium crateris TaxID=2528175 RepID=UPI001389BA35|nr:hypothetical protein [Undibacterium crateris]NDI85103.1 hypothetical protein [Undibacterium crateris]